MDEMAPARLIDIAFGVCGDHLVRDYRAPLFQSLLPLLPWIESEPGAGIVGLRITEMDGTVGLLAQRAKLTLRVPVSRMDDTLKLQGQRVQVGDDALAIGAARARPLQSFPTLYAEMVHLLNDDEMAFSGELAVALATLGASDCRFILGRKRAVPAGKQTLHGFPVALHHCADAQSIRLQESGVGSARALGLGIFVPHKQIRLT